MTTSTRRAFTKTTTAATLAGLTGMGVARGQSSRPTRSKRDRMMDVLDMSSAPGYIPAGFFMHFGKRGDAAVKAHLDYFHATGMDFVKIQFDEQTLPAEDQVKTAKDWARIPVRPEQWWEPSLYLLKNLVKEAKSEALIIQTLYSPYQMAKQAVPVQLMLEHVQQDAESVSRGMENITLSLLHFVQAAARAGVDGFYTCSQGGETNRIADRTLFNRTVKAFDMMLYKEVAQLTAYNVMHICDYDGAYNGFESRFQDYPGKVVNVPLSADGKPLTLRHAAEVFRRPVMGGLDRHGILSTGSPEQVKRAALEVLREAPPNVILAADCTVNADIPIANLQTAIRTAHEFRA